MYKKGSVALQLIQIELIFLDMYTSNVERKETGKAKFMIEYILKILMLKLTS